MESKKRSLGAAERDEFLRTAWRLLFAGRVDAERLVFVDEMGTNVSLCPLYAWSRRGERAHAKAPRNWGKNVTLLASITAEGLGPCLAVEGSTTREVFETYLERALAPTLERCAVVLSHRQIKVFSPPHRKPLRPWYAYGADRRVSGSTALITAIRPGQIVVMDNLSAHKGGKVKEIIEGRGCELIYLPPYSPDFNPIEQAFSKVKGLMRRAEARTRESLIEAMGLALCMVSAQDSQGFFGHCGYSSMDQLL